MQRPLPHRVRRLRWEVQTPATTDAFALRTALRQQADAVEAALAEGLSAADRSGVVLRIEKLELDVRVPSLEALDVELGARVLVALREALASISPVEQSASAHARAQWSHYIETGSLHWPLAGLTREEAQFALESSAVAAAESWLAGAAELPVSGRVPFTARVAAFERWLALLPDVVRTRLVDHARRTRASEMDAASDSALAEAASSAIEACAARLASMSGAVDAPAALRRWIDGRRGARGAPQSSAVDRMPAAIASHAESIADVTASSTQVSNSNAPSMRGPESAPAGALDATGQFVPHAGLVLLHPYLSRLFTELGLWDRGARGPLPPDEASRAISVLRWLAAGRDDPHEHELPIIKLLAGLRPEEPLDRRPPATTTQEREEGAALLAAVIGHWPALRNTGIDALRSNFLQRRGLLARRDGAWHLHLETKPFDMLLALLPWSLSPIRLPWSDAPLYVEWRTP